MRLAALDNVRHDLEVPQAGFAEEPMTTWEISGPATSRTGLTLPGLEGSAISGSIPERSISSSTS